MYGIGNKSIINEAVMTNVACYLGLFTRNITFDIDMVYDRIRLVWAVLPCVIGKTIICLL